MEQDNIIFFKDREEWRKWLHENFDRKKEVWFVFPKKSSHLVSISYNDAVEEALCFGWIDSIMKSLDHDHRMLRFTPRNPKSSYSQPNRERLRWLADQNLIHQRIRPQIDKIIGEEFVFPEDIMAALKEDTAAWNNFQKFTESYKRIRVAYIESARLRPDEYAKRLKNFIEKTRANKIIGGYGGIDKYY